MGEQMEWGFRYEGSIAATKDANCVTCLAAMQGKCPTHGQMAAAGCAHCEAVKGGPCHKHHGVEASMKHAEGDGAIGVDALVDFKKACGEALAEIAAFDPKFKNVSVFMRGMRSPRGRELAVELTAR